MSFNRLYNILKPHQKYIVDKVIKSYSNNDYFFISAPTGSGKTLTTLTIIKYLQENNYINKVLWFTRTHNEFYPVIRDVNKFDIPLNVSPIVGKLKACRNPLKVMTHFFELVDVCQYCKTKDYIADRLIPQKYRELMSVDALVKSIAPTLCPYNTLLASSIYADIILLTYPYLLGAPRKKLDNALNYDLIVIDEAHNVENIPQILAMNLSLHSLHTLKANGYNVSSLIELHDNVLGNEKMKYVSKELFKGALIHVDRKVFTHCMDLISISNYTSEHVVKSLAELCSFMNAIDYKFFDIYATRYGFRLMVTDPYEIISNLFTTKTIFMSGSLPSYEYIKNVWGIDGLYIDIETEINFKFGERKWFIADDVTTKLVLRSKYIDTYKEYLMKLLKTAKPVVLVVFPSYEFMSRFTDIAKHYECIIEHEEGTKIEEVINKVINENIKCIYAVAGGRLTEGIEVTKDSKSLIKTIIMVGVPYPEPSEYLTKKTEKLLKRIRLNSELKYRYLFHEPAKILTKQAIGRGIRHEEDVNIILLLDWRYKHFITDLNIDKFTYITVGKKKDETKIKKIDLND